MHPVTGKGDVLVKATRHGVHLETGPTLWLPSKPQHCLLYSNLLRKKSSLVHYKLKMVQQTLAESIKQNTTRFRITFHCLCNCTVLNCMYLWAILLEIVDMLSSYSLPKVLCELRQVVNLFMLKWLDKDDTKRMDKKTLQGFIWKSLNILALEIYLTQRWGPTQKWRISTSGYFLVKLFAAKLGKGFLM